MQIRNVWALGFALGSIVLSLQAADPPPPSLTLTVTNTLKTVSWPRTLLPALEQNALFVATTNLTNFTAVPAAGITANPAGYVYRTATTAPHQFYSLALLQMSSNDLLRANVLNRLAYGPTPDELERVATITPQGYIDEQLAPQNLPGTFDSYTAVTTNGVNLPPSSNWTTVTVTGTVSSSVLYMYLRSAGDLYIDDVRLQLVETNINCVTNITATETNIVCTTNLFLGPNVLVNGNFEQQPAVGVPGWTVAPNHINSSVTTDIACEGAQSLHMVANPGGSTGTSAIQQTITPALPVNRRVALTFSYLPNANSSELTIRLSGSGLIISGKDAPPAPAWIYETVTGTSTGSRFLYVYISDAGEAWIDDLKLVSGSVAEVGPNLLQNGDFESPLGSPWLAVGNHSGSVVDNTVSRSGSGSLHVIATGRGSGNSTSGNSVVQTNINVVANGTYTISYWYRPSPQGHAVTVRLSGQPNDQSPDREPGGLRRRLDAANWGVTLDEMRRWHCNNAVGSPRQLLEVLTQFFENHFVTYHSKTADYFDRYYDGGILDRIATDLEYREVSRWREALLNPNCTFYDLLKIHVESPAQIIYLDTVESRGDGTRIANENYARELYELFAMGVDNGYDQNDIVAMSRAWTGWTVDIVDRSQMNNPFAPRSQQYGQYPGVGFNAVSNIVGVWSFVYNPTWHGTNRADPLSVWAPNTETNPVATGPKRYAARVGPPWAGQPYQIVIPPRTGTNGIQDGYQVIQSLSVNIHTAEYLSAKLCRIFVHDNFPNPTTRPELPEYAFYDYTNPNRSAEAELVRRCIVAWDTAGPDGRKGHIRAVLRRIFESELFRSHAGSRQKVKTPLEFLASSVRALRSVDPVTGQATAFTDGNFASALSRMGQMSLFNRADPDGYPESGPPWISAGTLAERLRFVQALLLPATGDDAGNNTVNPVALLQRKLPSGSWYNAGDVADFFLTILYFGEGKANLDLYRASAISFLNTDDNGTTVDLLRPSMTAAVYDTRIRGMVAMLMTLQRFQEQ